MSEFLQSQDPTGEQITVDTNGAVVFEGDTGQEQPTTTVVVQPHEQSQDYHELTTSDPAFIAVVGGLSLIAFGPTVFRMVRDQRRKNANVQFNS